MASHQHAHERQYPYKVGLVRTRESVHALQLSNQLPQLVAGMRLQMLGMQIRSLLLVHPTRLREPRSPHSKLPLR